MDPIAFAATGGATRVNDDDLKAARVNDDDLKSLADATRKAAIGFGTKFKYRRMALGISRARLARLVGTTAHSIRAWENGRNIPRIDHALAIAAVLDVPL